MSTQPTQKEGGNILLSLLFKTDGNGERRPDWVNIIVAGLAVLYGVNPVDLVPDALFPIGYVDDLGLLAAALIWLFRHRNKKGTN